MSRRTAPALVLLAVLLAGCGDGSAPPKPSGPPATAGALFQGPTPTGGLEGGDLPVGGTLTGAPATALTRLGDVVYASGLRWTGALRGSAVTLRPESGELSRMLGTNGQISDAVADGRGGVYLAGDFDRAGGARQRGIVHVFGTGLPDPKFQPRLRGFVAALAFDRGVLYAGGSPDGLQGPGTRGVVAVNAVTGKPVEDFETDVAPGVTELAVRGDTLYAGGSTPGLRSRFATDLTEAELEEPPLVALDKLTGARDPAFRPPALYPTELQAPISALKVLGGKLWVARSLLGKQGVGLALLDPVTGARVGTTSLRGEVRELVQDGRRVLVAGNLQGDLVRAVSLGGARPLGFRVRAANDRQIAHDLVLRGKQLWIGGLRAAARNGLPPSGFVRVVGGGSVKAPAPDGPVNALVSAGGRIVVGGDFAALDVERQDLGAFSATTGRPLPGTRLPRTRAARALTSAGGRLWVLDGRRLLVVDPATGGTVRTVPVTEASALTAAGGRVFVVSDGEVRAFDARTGAPVRFALPLESADGRPPVLLGDGDRLWVGGSFDRTGRDGAPAKLSILELDPRTGKLDAGFDPHLDGPVRGLALEGERLYASGLFTRAGELRRRNLAALEPGTGAAIDAFEPGPAPADAERILRLGETLLVRGAAGTPRAFAEDGGPAEPALRTVSATAPGAAETQVVAAPFRRFSTLGDRPERGVILPPKG